MAVGSSEVIRERIAARTYPIRGPDTACTRHASVKGPVEYAAAPRELCRIDTRIGHGRAECASHRRSLTSSMRDGSPSGTAAYVAFLRALGDGGATSAKGFRDEHACACLLYTSD